MRAVRYDRLGGGDVLELVEMDRPDPGPGEVRVALSVSGVNPTDWKRRAGSTGAAPDGWQIPHHDGAGVIDAVGEGVDPSRIGQPVWVWLAAANSPWGTAAEYTVVADAKALPLPPGVSPELGASLGVPAITAQRALLSDGPIDGATVLVAGGAGAVGHFAIELAKYHGATVVSTVSTSEKAELARAAGADAVVNYREAGAVDALRAALGGPADRIVEVAFGANMELDLAVSGPGTVVSVYASEATDPVLPIRSWMNASARIRFLVLYGLPEPDLLVAVADVEAALRAGALSALPVRRFSLEQTSEAQGAVQAGAVGKVLVDVTS